MRNGVTGDRGCGTESFSPAGLGITGRLSDNGLDDAGAVGVVDRGHDADILTMTHACFDYRAILRIARSLLMAAALPVVVPVGAQGQDAISREFASVRPLLQRVCHDCHSGARIEAEVDLSTFESVEAIRRQAEVWRRVHEMLATEQMPPPDAPQPTRAERRRMRDWVHRMLVDEARSRAGDPGPVILRRLSNAEYTYTVRDLTGVTTLDPAREFPVDGAAGEGFTNTGAALVMSPSLVRKYLEAGKAVAAHAALYPDGIRFSEHTTRRDLTDGLLKRLRAFYARYTTTGGGSAVDLQGIRFETNQGGLLPLGRYLAATLSERDALRGNERSIEEVARERDLSPAYLSRLWTVLTDTKPRSLLLERLRQRWNESSPEGADALTAEIALWQRQLWRFNVVGHLGREGAPQSWMELALPIVDRQDFRVPLPQTRDDSEVVIRLHASDAGDGSQHDYVRWQDLRLEGEGVNTVRLHEAMAVHARLQALRMELKEQADRYLRAAADALQTDQDGGVIDVGTLATRHRLKAQLLSVWLRYLNISASQVPVKGHFTNKMLRGGDYDFVTGWGTGATPSLMANSSDQQVRIPGIARPHGLIAHPSPTLFSALGWRSSIRGPVRITAAVADAHPECGNGVEWWLQHRSGSYATTLGHGEFGVGGTATVPSPTINVRPGDLVSLIIGPRDGHHYCDLTAIDLTINEAADRGRTWDASADVSASILQSNPHPDGFGQADAWHFYKGPLERVTGTDPGAPQIPSGSLLASWLNEPRTEIREQLGVEIRKLLAGPGPEPDTPDGRLHSQISSLPLPLGDQVLFENLPADTRFGKHPLGGEVDESHLIMHAPATLEFRLPAELMRGRELAGRATLDPAHGQKGSVRLHISAGDPVTGTPVNSPFLCAPGSEARQHLRDALQEFGELFPIALCYTRIVPVDEVVTATLFHREDALLQELMLTEREASQLDRLWDELRYVSQEPLRSVVALEQIREFSTQDRQDLVGPWDRLKPAVLKRADAFRERVRDTHPAHLDSVLTFADRAWRRPLTTAEKSRLRQLYRDFTAAGLDHEDAIRLLLARVLASPSFLYRGETPPAGGAAAPVSDLELANRLSYFLWSSLPDRELRTLADTGKLSAPAGRAQASPLIVQTRRMLRHSAARRLAEQFACQWLHIRNFDQTVEKNERLYPQFANLRAAMNEEAVRFFEDMIRSNGSVLGIIAADHTFLNGALAEHYGVDGVKGAKWRRVNGMLDRGRGGVAGMAAVLASQSGASRTSPILRGTWISETLLGERLPRPPRGVPELPAAVPSGLTARELIEQHSSSPGCARCHSRIDPWGFALEAFDTLGASRTQVVDTAAVLPDGEHIDGLAGLQEHLLTVRRDDFLRQFCRKLLGYALGREIQLSDEVLLARMHEHLVASDYRFSAAVETIVTSRQFREIRGRSYADTH